MDTHERILAARSGVRRLYESHYLKANAPDGARAVWLKHTLLVRPDGNSIVELWAVLFSRGAAPRVAKREVPWAQASLDPHAVRIETPHVTLSPSHATGRIADIAWDVGLSHGHPPVFHLPHAWMYTAPFPRAKLLTPAPRLTFDGQITVGDTRWPVEGWIGSRGHNWGAAHTHAYAYGNCHLWDDGVTDRVIDGISAKVVVAGATSPWLTAVVGRAPDVMRNRIRDFAANRCEVEATRWRVESRADPATSLDIATDASSYVGLRYLHPDGAVSYCYNTKFAEVAWRVGDRAFTSPHGELEVLGPEPLPEVPLHPAAGWDARDGDYRSEEV